MRHVILYIMMLIAAFPATAMTQDSLQGPVENMPAQEDTLASDACQPVCDVGRVNVGTNALGWLMLVPNVSVEYAFNRRFSLAVDGCYSAWNYFSHKVKFRTLSFTVSGRWWFASKGKRSFFAGVHAGMREFNYALGGRWRYQDHSGKHPAWGGGLDVGCRQALDGRQGRWFLDMSVGAGVYSVYRDKFENRYNGHLVSTKRHALVGIDRLSVSLVYCFHNKNCSWGK